jgi:hypothetical protein
VFPHSLLSSSYSSDSGLLPRPRHQNTLKWTRICASPLMARTRAMARIILPSLPYASMKRCGRDIPPPPPLHFEGSLSVCFDILPTGLLTSSESSPWYCLGASGSPARRYRGGRGSHRRESLHCDPPASKCGLEQGGPSFAIHG